MVLFHSKNSIESYNQKKNLIMLDMTLSNAVKSMH